MAGVGGVASAGEATGLRTGDWGGKALLVCALAVLMAIPGLFVLALVSDREHRAQGVIQEVSNLQGGAQQVLGPMLIAPWTAPAPQRQAGDAGPAPGPLGGWYVVSASSGAAKVDVRAASLHRSIFQVPVYEAAADISANFAAAPTNYNLPAGAKIDWTAARLVMGFSDLRGAKSDVVGLVTGPEGASRVEFSPASDVSLGGSGGAFGLVSAPAAAIAAKGGRIDIRIRFTGAQRLSVLPFAKSTTVAIAGDWPSPSFDGAFLPETRDLAAGRFSANWSVPFIARGLSDSADSSALSFSSLSGKDLGVSFVPANNPYQSVQRALKYAVMFVGLVFLSFFVFESLSGKRLHPAQYVLIGLAQMVFYLLLLSLAEYIDFDLAFAVAATATVALIGLYAGAAFRSRKLGAVALAIFSLVYGLIYFLMQLEDFALLAGSLASFVGLAAAMYLTRHIDWYGGGSGRGDWLGSRPRDQPLA
jgi:inner membrane protein